jgi:Peptidase family M48
MKAKTAWGILFVALLARSIPIQAQTRSQIKEQSLEAGRDEVAAIAPMADRIVAREQQITKELRKYSPRAETYLQQFRIDRELGPVVSGDRYFIGRLKFGKKPYEATFRPETGFIGPLLHSLHNKMLPIYGVRFDLSSPGILIDQNFDRSHYIFSFVRREFLGDVRCLVFDITPRPRHRGGRFNGRIWVEDQDYTIVRFNGTHIPTSRMGFEAHEDSWRQNLQPGLWLPVYVYSEESDLKVGRHAVRIRAQTWLWGYKLTSPEKQEELTKVLVEAPEPVREADAAHDLSPLESQRQWEKEAEDNMLERLEKAGLLSPTGAVDNVLSTVANNLVVTNNLNYLSDLRCRVMLTSPLESFTVGHTLVLSRGLIDVLPDEASLAMVLAHEIGHIAAGGQMNTKYAFNDTLSMRDEDLLNALMLRSDTRTEEGADKKGAELLKNSPYKDKLGNAGLFLKALSDEAKDAPSLLGAQLGNRLVAGKHLMRMAELMNVAPELQPQRLDQIAALPLGSRVKLDAWSGQTDLIKSKPVAIVAAREKMPFQVTHLYPYLTRKETTAQNVQSRPDVPR